MDRRADRQKTKQKSNNNNKRKRNRKTRMAMLMNIKANWSALVCRYWSFRFGIDLIFDTEAANQTNVITCQAEQNEEPSRKSHRCD